MDLTARLAQIGRQLAESRGETVHLTLSGAAYTSRHFENMYEATASSIGRRFAFSVAVSTEDDVMTVSTTPADENVARNLIVRLERATRNDVAA